MKHQHIIQRLCLFLLLVASSVGAWATDYACVGYEIFRSRDAGKNMSLTTLTRTNVNVTFSNCKTSKGTGDNAIYQPAKGSTITVKAADGYAIRWIILRDTEGGKDYNNSEGIKRVSGVTSGYNYYFERNAVSNSRVSGANQNNLNDDDNNIVVTQYDATAQSVVITTHNNSSWGQFKVRDIIVGYVRVCKAAFQQSSMSAIAYVTTQPGMSMNGYDGTPVLKSDNNNVATVDGTNFTGREFGSTTLRATFPATSNYAKGESSMTVNIQRDPVTMSFKTTPPDVIYTNGLPVGGNLMAISDYVNFTTGSGLTFSFSDGFFGTSNNEASLKVNNGQVTWGGTTGAATITARQSQNSRYGAASISFTLTVVRSDKAGTVLIRDANEWKVFASLVNDKGLTKLNAKLDADIDLGTDIAMVGTESHRYAGTFDGGGHSITMNWNGSGAIAPFLCVENASVKNLTVKGSITDNKSQVGGLICTAYGKVTVSNCVSDLALKAPGNMGGLVYETKTGSTLTVTDCLMNGTFECTQHSDSWGLIVNANASTCTISNCLYTGASVNNASVANISGRTYNNCYYLMPCNAGGAKQITAAQLKSGEVAWLLQNGRSNNTWGMSIGTDVQPWLTADAAKRVYKVSFKQGGKEVAARYANRGGTVTLPTIEELAGGNVNPDNYYKLSFGEGFTASTPVTADRTVTVTFTDLDYYPIANADDWKAFAQEVQNGKEAMNARLTADIELDSSCPMIGSQYYSYSGVFDGNGHSITLNINGVVEYAPFYAIKKATIKNVRTKGNISVTGYVSSGLINMAYGTNFISNCISEVNISSSYYNGPCSTSGIVQYIDRNINTTISYCVVMGTFTATSDEGKKGMSGFCYEQNGQCTLNNCLYIGSNNAIDWWAVTFAKNATLNNCYYLNPCGAAQGTQVTERQLKSGEVVKLLQAGRTNLCYWAQTLGEMPSLYSEALKAKENYVYYDTGDQGWVCGNFHLGSGELPVGLDFTAKQLRNDRKLTRAGNYTVCLPYELPLPATAKAYTLSRVDESGKTARFVEVTANVLEANKPYLLVVSDNTSLDSDMPTNVLANSLENMEQGDGNFKFVGTLNSINNATAAAHNAYILQDDNRWHRVTSDYTSAIIPAYRAYITSATTAGAKALNFTLGDEATGISTIETTDGEGTVRYYDLQGRYIGTSLDGQPKGIYIRNGKKVINK